MHLHVVSVHLSRSAFALFALQPQCFLQRYATAWNRKTESAVGVGRKMNQRSKQFARYFSNCKDVEKYTLEWKIFQWIFFLLWFGFRFPNEFNPGVVQFLTWWLFFVREKNLNICGISRSDFERCNWYIRRKFIVSIAWSLLFSFPFFTISLFLHFPAILTTIWLGDVTWLSISFFSVRKNSKQRF